MRPPKLAAAALLLALSPSVGSACDSYDDDMSLASLLAKAVSEARANGTLPAAGALASPAGAPEQPAPPAAAGSVGAAGPPNS
jgi:hypothetical protein